MNDYKQSKFYLIARDLSPHIWEEICRDAKDKSYNWWIDDQPAWQRQKIDMGFDEVLKYLYTEKIHFSIVHRRGYPKENVKDNWNEWHLEIGFCTMIRRKKLPTTDIDIEGDLFLWIKLDEKYIPYFIDKYKLETT
jgi:hypothetical protein